MPWSLALKPTQTRVYPLDSSSDSSSSHPAESSAWASRSAGVCAVGRRSFCQKLIDTVNFYNLGAAIPCLRSVCTGTFGKADVNFPRVWPFRKAAELCWCWALCGGPGLSPRPCCWCFTTLRQHLLLTFTALERELPLGADTWDLCETQLGTCSRVGCVTVRWQSPLCAEHREGLAAPPSLSARGGFVQFTLGWAPPYSINPAFCQSYFCLGSLADPRRAVLDLVPKSAQMWVELKSYQFQCMQGYFPKDV